MLMSFVFARRIRPIYRAVRKDVEEIDGRVGETFSGIRVVRAFGREKRELLDYMRGRHSGAAQGALRAAPRAAAVDVVGPARLERQRRHHLVRRLSEHRRPARRSATSWRSSGTCSCSSIRSGTSSIRSRSCSDRSPPWSASSKCWRCRTTSPIGPMRGRRRVSFTRSRSRASSSSIAKAGPSSATST